MQQHLLPACRRCWPACQAMTLTRMCALHLCAFSGRRVQGSAAHMGETDTPSPFASLLCSAWAELSSSSTDLIVCLDVKLDNKARVKITCQDAWLVLQHTGHCVCLAHTCALHLNHLNKSRNRICTALPAGNLPRFTAHVLICTLMFLRTWSGTQRCWNPC
jgi:hypothetical protein